VASGVGHFLGSEDEPLVHCNAGKSRSCGLVAVWLARRERIPLDDALARVAAKRPEMWITPDFRETLDAALDT
jgi:protein-tyrosine phosphatase